MSNQLKNFDDFDFDEESKKDQNENLGDEEIDEHVVNRGRPNDTSLNVVLEKSASKEIKSKDFGSKDLMSKERISKRSDSFFGPSSARLH